MLVQPSGTARDCYGTIETSRSWLRYSLVRSAMIGIWAGGWPPRPGVKYTISSDHLTNALSTQYRSNTLIEGEHRAAPCARAVGWPHLTLLGMECLLISKRGPKRVGCCDEDGVEGITHRLEDHTTLCLNCLSRMASWRARAACIATWCCSQRVVEPSMSVKRNVTVPVVIRPQLLYSWCAGACVHCTGERQVHGAAGWSV